MLAKFTNHEGKLPPGSMSKVYITRVVCLLIGINFHFETDLGILIFPFTNGFNLGSLMAVILQMPVVESVKAVK
jgi:hypothetical protein